MSNLVLITVVDGSVIVPEDSNEEPHVIALALPLSVIEIIKVSFAFGVPERLVVIEVMACCNPVIYATSVLSVFIVGVADWVTTTVRFVCRLLLNVWVAASPATVSVVDGKVNVCESAPAASVIVLFAVNVFPLAIVKVALVAGAVIATLFIEVAVATPRTGVIKVGVFASTTAPLPVIADIAVPLILKTLPVPAVSSVLLVSVAVEDAEMKVSVFCK